MRKPLSTAKLFRAVCLALGFALLGSACTGPQRDAGRNGVRGGTLRLYDKTTPSPGQQYANLIAGAAAFGAKRPAASRA